jgi:hypothetical protein
MALASRSDVVDLDAVAAIGAPQQEQLRILGDRAPRVDIGLGHLLATARALVAQLQPLVARDVLAAHRQRRSTEGGGAQPGFGPSGASSPASAAAIAARVSSALADGRIRGYDMAA